MGTQSMPPLLHFLIPLISLRLIGQFTQNRAETEKENNGAEGGCCSVGDTLRPIHALDAHKERKYKCKGHKQNYLAQHGDKKTYFRLGYGNERRLASSLHAEYKHTRHENGQIFIGKREQCLVGREHSAERMRENHHYQHDAGRTYRGIGLPRKFLQGIHEKGLYISTRKYINVKTR